MTTAAATADLVRSLLADLREERESLATFLGGIPEELWDRPTPAPDWTVRHQVAHLAFFDHAGAVSIGDPVEFADERAAADADPDGYGAAVLEPLLAMSGPELLRSWDKAGVRFAEAASRATPKVRVPWYGPSMTVPSMITARIMETWAHGQDVVDGLGVDRPVSPRLPHIARLACLARPNPYVVRGLEPPTTPLRVDLTTVEGGSWSWGEDDAEQSVSGEILDFCLVMTRRRHVDDTALVARGPDAQEWLLIGQAYAGDPGPGRAPRPQADTPPGFAVGGGREARESGEFVTVDVD